MSSLPGSSSGGVAAAEATTPSLDRQPRASAFAELGV